VKPRTALIYCVCVMFASMAVMGGVSLLMVRRSEQKFCALIVAQDDGYNAPVPAGTPPLTERGRRIAEAIHRLRQDLACE
jgi:hypothetical protein